MFKTLAVVKSKINRGEEFAFHDVGSDLIFGSLSDWQCGRPIGFMA